mmetsp:Transcript_7580/g.21671  ORF Transcript_7580/g.21671 Transcript_7580/m.21671 type:complete len:216 (+) Transcript_7580:1886-2533(+)
MEVPREARPRPPCNLLPFCFSSARHHHTPPQLEGGHFHYCNGCRWPGHQARSNQGKRQQRRARPPGQPGGTGTVTAAGETRGGRRGTSTCPPRGPGPLQRIGQLPRGAQERSRSRQRSHKSRRPQERPWPSCRRRRQWRRRCCACAPRRRVPGPSCLPRRHGRERPGALRGCEQQRLPRRRDGHAQPTVPHGAGRRHGSPPRAVHALLGSGGYGL